MGHVWCSVVRERVGKCRKAWEFVIHASCVTERIGPRGTVHSDVDAMCADRSHARHTPPPTTPRIGIHHMSALDTWVAQWFMLVSYNRYM